MFPKPGIRTLTSSNEMRSGAMTTATATADSAILYRSRRRIAVWALALTLGGAAAGTATTLAVTHDDNTVSKAVPAAAVPGAVAVSNPQSLPQTADAMERWIGATPSATPTSPSSPSLNADSPDSYNNKLGPGPH
jgi:hypothetical protein